MNADEKEILRHAILEAAVLRHPNALTARALRRSVAVEVAFAVALADAEAAAAFQVSLGNFTVETDPLGSTRYYTATAAGVLAVERGGR